MSGQGMEEMDGLPRLHYARYFAVSSVPYMLNAVFLVALVYKLKYSPHEYSWFRVFFPFVLGDVWLGVLRRSHTVDSVGSALTKIAVCMYLSGLLPGYVNVVMLFIPLWASVLVSTYFRCAFSTRSEFSILVRTCYHLVCRVAQPFLVALQLDGAGADWVVVLTPAWTGLVLCFSGALFLIYCAPLIRMHSLESLQAEATILLLLCCMYLLCISLCGFLTVFWLAQDLDYVTHTGNRFGRHVPVLQVVLPALLLQVVLAVLQPSISYQSRKFQLMTLLANADVEEAFRREERYKLIPVTTDIWLCRQSGESANCMYRTTSASYQLLGFSTHEKLLRVVEELAHAENTAVMAAAGFNTPAADPGLGTEHSRLLTGSTKLQSSYRSISISDQIVNTADCDIETGLTAAGTGISERGQNRLCLAEGSCTAAADPSEEETCIICYSNRGDVCLMNCGHGGICFQCASTLATKRARLCPVCRGEIKKVLRVNPLFFWLRKGVGMFYSSMGYDVVVDEDLGEDSESDPETSDGPG